MPAAGSNIELRCRSFIPAHINPENTDQRSLGFCVARLQLDGMAVALQDEAAFGLGWHALEGEPEGLHWRFAHRLPAYRTFGALTDDEPLDLPNRQTRPRSGPA